MNFVVFCEMLVEKCVNLKRIILRTGEEATVESFNALKKCLSKNYGVCLKIELRKFHDREIR